MAQKAKIKLNKESNQKKKAQRRNEINTNYNQKTSMQLKEKDH